MFSELLLILLGMIGLFVMLLENILWDFSFIIGVCWDIKVSMHLFVFEFTSILINNELNI